jgi:hypothetical protein
MSLLLLGLASSPVACRAKLRKRNASRSKDRAWSLRRKLLEAQAIASTGLGVV